MNEIPVGDRGLQRIPLRVENGLGTTGAAEDRRLRVALAELPALLASAPHRMLFFAGASAVVVSMLWWSCFLAAGYFGHAFPAAPVPPGWAHAMFVQYGMLPPFIFGFLLTVFPRWMGQPALRQRQYVPVFVGVFGGYLLAHVGLLSLKPVLIAGIGLMMAGWIAGLIALGGVLLRNGAQDRHALSCFVALGFGVLGLGAFAAFALGAPWWLAVAAIKGGTFLVLLPIFFTVCHRMVPFFSASVVGPTYRVVKPPWSLPLVWLLCLAHFVLELGHRFDAAWAIDALLAGVFLWHWIAWQPWKCLRPGLLAVLHIAFAWLPVAFALFAVQSAILWLDGAFVLGRAPVHALTVGFFASMLVAMVTRVTQGHSGRMLELGTIPAMTFVLLQIVVAIRIGAEVASNTPLWLVIAAFGWLAAFLPWALRSLWIYATPRVDGKPG
ncbi:MAG: NnrS family protein [Proteobacteria bacterium]|nr:NnrS family protein [Pseudomonadota bacterium]